MTTPVLVEAAINGVVRKEHNPNVPRSRDEIGRDLIAELALQRGGHVHVGLEAYSGSRQPTNTELVGEVVSLARSLGREPVDHRECAAFLGFVGG